jgi:hypothetical protein
MLLKTGLRHMAHKMKRVFFTQKQTEPFSVSHIGTAIWLFIWLVYVGLPEKNAVSAYKKPEKWLTMCA